MRRSGSRVSRTAAGTGGIAIAGACSVPLPPAGAFALTALAAAAFTSSALAAGVFTSTALAAGVFTSSALAVGEVGLGPRAEAPAAFAGTRTSRGGTIVAGVPLRPLGSGAGSASEPRLLRREAAFSVAFSGGAADEGKTWGAAVARSAAGATTDRFPGRRDGSGVSSRGG